MTNGEQDNVFWAGATFENCSNWLGWNRLCCTVFSELAVLSFDGLNADWGYDTPEDFCVRDVERDFSYDSITREARIRNEGDKFLKREIGEFDERIYILSRRKGNSNLVDS